MKITILPIKQTEDTFFLTCDDCGWDFDITESNGKWECPECLSMRVSTTKI